MKIIFSPKKIFYSLIYMSAFLVFLNILVYILHYNGYLQDGLGLNIYNNFNMDWEHNVPTYFSSSIILFSSFLMFICFILHYKKTKHYYGWLILSLIFLFLSFDEITQVHEHLAKVMRAMGVGTSGRFYYAVWTIPYIAFGATTVVILYKFLFSIDTKTRNGYILSGIVYVIGAVGFEVLLSVVRIKELDIVFFTLEEFFELLGFILFIYFTLDYIGRQFKTLSFELKTNKTEGFFEDNTVKAHIRQNLIDSSF